MAICIFISSNVVVLFFYPQDDNISTRSDEAAALSRLKVAKYLLQPVLIAFLVLIVLGSTAKVQSGAPALV